MTDFIDTQQWQRYIENEIGFVLPMSQRLWLSNAITATAKNNHVTVSQLWQLVHQDSRVRQQLLDATLILESRFFRHLPSLLYVADLAEAHQQMAISTGSGQDADSTFRIWSVGCSRGQEVWSLAMLLEHQQISNYEILGSDVSLEAIKTAQQARYTERDKQAIAPQYHHYLSQIKDDSDPQNKTSDWQIVNTIRNKVSFKYHNVFTTVIPTPLKQHVIICQNMLIYFRQFDQRDILARLAAQCEVGGHLILAPGEALFWHHPKMKRLPHTEVNVWQKVTH